MPGGAGDITPPSEKDGILQANGSNGQQSKGGNTIIKGNGVTPNTPAATPGATVQSQSGIIPTLQYVMSRAFYWLEAKQRFLSKEHRRNGQSRLPLGPQDDRSACEKR